MIQIKDYKLLNKDKKGEAVERVVSTILFKIYDRVDFVNFPQKIHPLNSLIERCHYDFNCYMNNTPKFDRIECKGISNSFSSIPLKHNQLNIDYCFVYSHIDGCIIVFDVRHILNGFIYKGGPVKPLNLCQNKYRQHSVVIHQEEDIDKIVQFVQRGSKLK